MDEQKNPAELASPEAPLSKKEQRAQRKAIKKAEKRIKKLQKKAARKAQPWYRKLFRLLISLAIIAAVPFFIFLSVQAYITANVLSILQDSYQSAYDTELTDEMRDAFAPLDPEGAAAIDALPVYSEDDTWAVYVYICGSNLESCELNEMSTITERIIAPTVNEIEASTKQNNAEMLSTFMQEITEQGMDLPSYMYEPVQRSYSSDVSEQVNDQYGLLSAEINHMTQLDLPENLNVVIQAGGSKRWSHPLLNPNRSRRLLLNSDGLSVIEDNPICNVGDRDTLADFLSFCEQNYSADHKVLLMMNHGGASFGACIDEIYADDTLRLKEMRGALEQVYDADEKNPPLELVGFHACLMSSAEVANAFRGFTKYMVSCEEVLVDTWIIDRDSFWLTELVRSFATNGARIGKDVVDSYIDFWNKLSYTEFLFLKPNEHMSISMNVLDITKAAKAYDAYCELMDIALRDAVKDPSVLATLSQAANKSIRYAGDAYYAYNTIDLSLFMEALQDSYPAQAKRIIKAVDDSVLYNRASGVIKDSRGLSIYYPLSLEGNASVAYYLMYLNNVCEDESTKALYYYKLAGCLNDDYQSYVNSKGYGQAKALELYAFDGFGTAELDVSADGNFSVSVDEKALALTQSATYNLCLHNEAESKVVYYGTAKLITQDDTTIETAFRGKWLCMDGNMLALETINTNESFAQYKSPVSINGTNYSLILSQDKHTDEVKIVGISKEDDDAALDYVGRDDLVLKPGDIIAPLYETNSLAPHDNPRVIIVEKGKEFKYDPNCKLELCDVPDGTYLSFVTLEDIRGDKYDSHVVRLELKNGKVSQAQVMLNMKNIRS